MGRKKLDLRSYLSLHPHFHLYLRVHAGLSPSELSLVLQQNQSSFLSEFKWYRRTYPDLESSIAILKTLPDILNDLSGTLQINSSVPIPCKCRLCFQSAQTKKAQQQQQFRNATIQANVHQTSTTHLVSKPKPHKLEPKSVTHPKEPAGAYAHDQCCLRVLGRGFLIRTFDKQPPTSSIQLPPQTQLPSLFSTPQARQQAQHYARVMFRVVCEAQMRQWVDAAALNRALVVSEALNAIPIPLDPSFRCTRQKGPSISYPGLGTLSRLLPFKQLGRSTSRPAFPLPRPEEMVLYPTPVPQTHPAGTQGWASPFDISLFLRRVNIALQEIPPSIPSPLRQADSLGARGVKEMLVALAVATGCGTLPIRPEIFPPHLRLSPPTAPGQLPAVWERTAGQWASTVGHTLGLSTMVPDADDSVLAMDMVRHQQLLQMELLCDYLIS
eukprot:gnl/Dysnectes_brevis/3822_a4922_801.p1 GENE.gnl/Dysnectes_brevis/3822_a4922_801~~gnl/Dysnectes_brevis/3822_a4922_801.p1  ORF type:complete len:440 (-),score=76.45 gnl/Dysnectes_brevis/3822_a4922_801:167-1486(-)